MNSSVSATARFAQKTLQPLPDSGAVENQVAARAMGVCKSYYKSALEIPVLRGVDLRVYSSEFLAIIGQSGSGKSTILHIAAEMSDLVARTRAGQAKLDELRGGTFTLTSVGSIGGVLATPILNIPEVAILGVNAIRDAAVVRDGEVVVRKMMYLSPSFDHRIIDGAVGARFVAALKAVLENPESLLLELR